MLLSEMLVLTFGTILVLLATVNEGNAQPGSCDSDSPKAEIVVMPKKPHGKKPNRKLEKLLQGLMSWSMGPMSEQAPPAPPVTWLQPSLPQDVITSQYYTPKPPQYAPSQYYSQSPPNYTPPPHFYKTPVYTQSSKYFDLYDAPQPYYSPNPQLNTPVLQQHASPASGEREPRQNFNSMENFLKYLFSF